MNGPLNCHALLTLVKSSICHSGRAWDCQTRGVRSEPTGGNFFCWIICYHFDVNTADFAYYRKKSFMNNSMPGISECVDVVILMSIPGVGQYQRHRRLSRFDILIHYEISSR